MWTLLQIEDEGLAVPDSRGPVTWKSRPLNLGLATAQRRTHDGAVRGNSNVDDKLLKEELVKVVCVLQEVGGLRKRYQRRRK